MSYFIVISGKNVALVNATAGRLLPIIEAQPYVANLAQEIQALDGSPSFFWDDSETGTSHELVCAAENGLFEDQPLESSALGQLIKSCELHNVTARVWWPTNEPNSFDHVARTSCAAEAFALIHAQAGKGAGIGFVLHPNYSSKPTADAAA